MPSAMKKRRWLEVMDNLLSFVERGEVGGLSERVRKRRMALLHLLELQVWFDLDEIDWECYLAFVQVGYVEAWDRLRSTEADHDEAAIEVDQALQATISMIDAAATEMEEQTDMTQRNRIAADAVAQSHNWHNTEAVIAFVYWRTDEALTRSNADSEKTRLLEKLVEYMETRHD